MARPKEPKDEKLMAGIIYANEGVYNAVKAALEAEYGSVDYESEELDFSHTDYYSDEMGQGLKRRFISFAVLVPPGRLSEIKLFANYIEDKTARAEGGRQVNIDPGLVSQSRLVLASAKNFSHRIYLKDGIFAEVTLIYRVKKGFTPLEWTFPEYASQRCREIMGEIREIYCKQVKLF